jgi:hypothetical protein
MGKCPLRGKCRTDFDYRAEILRSEGVSEYEIERHFGSRWMRYEHNICKGKGNPPDGWEYCVKYEASPYSSSSDDEYSSSNSGGCSKFIWWIAAGVIFLLILEKPINRIFGKVGTGEIILIIAIAAIIVFFYRKGKKR